MEDELRPERDVEGEAGDRVLGRRRPQGLQDHLRPGRGAALRPDGPQVGL